SVNISWKMSLPAQPDWIFQLIVAAGEAIPPPAPPVAGDAAPPPAGALDERHAVMNAPSAESPVYLRNPRRELFSRSTAGPPISRPTALGHEHSMPAVSACQVCVFARRHGRPLDGLRPDGQG